MLWIRTAHAAPTEQVGLVRTSIDPAIPPRLTVRAISPSQPKCRNDFHAAVDDVSDRHHLAHFIY